MSNTSRKNRVALVIEDEPIIGRVCRKTLAADGFDVDIALDGLIAKDMSDKNVYDLYISDIRTPEMNGMEFYHYFKKERPEITSRVIITTGDILSADVKAFLDEYKGVFLPKPFTPEDLMKAVGSVLTDCME
jgi:DNA-binding response OmpR family regulator